MADGKGILTEQLLENELKKEFNKSTLDDGWLDKTTVDGKWKITIDGISLNVPAGTNEAQIPEDESEKLLLYLSQENWSDFYDEENHCYKDNDSIGIKGSYLHEISDLQLFYYNGGIYKLAMDVSTNTPKIELVKFVNNMEEYYDEIEDFTILITPNTPENPIHFDYEGSYNLSDNMYFLKENNDLSLSRTYYITHENNKGTIVNNYYDDSGIFIVSGLNPRQVEVEGPRAFADMYYDEDDKPFTNGYYSRDTGNYYDETGKLVQVWRDAPRSLDYILYEVLNCCGAIMERRLKKEILLNI